MRVKHFVKLNWVTLTLLLSAWPAWLMAQEVLLFDDFNAAPLNTSIWGLATWNLGDRTQFGNQPEFGSEAGDTFIQLPLDT